MYAKLSDVFTDNILALRSDWINLSEYGESEPYILFNVDQNEKKVTFRTFKTIEEAEEHYLNDFIKQEGDFMVARLDVKYFVQLAFVYANYVLSNHRFLDVWLNFILAHIKENNHDSNYINNTIKKRVLVYSNEVKKIQLNEGEIIDFFEHQSGLNNKIKIQLKKWKEERDEDIRSRSEVLNQINEEIEKHKINKELDSRNMLIKVFSVILIVGIIYYIYRFYRRK